MRIEKLWIDGYGRFAARKVDIAPGLQIIAGPNEQGKTTLREFVSDILFGQSPDDNDHDGPDRRAPWDPSQGYGGRIAYVLDSGATFEIQRDLATRTAKIRSSDNRKKRRAGATDHSVNGEATEIVEAQLGLSKPVFLSVATISHHTLETLGDDEALATIRERLLTLTDVGAASASTEAAARWLLDRMEIVGRPDAHTRPLPKARSLIMDLQNEYEQCASQREDLLVLEEKRRDLRTEIEAESQQHTLLAEKVRAHEQYERRERLGRAEGLALRIDRLTKDSFALAGAREFPVEQVPATEQAAVLTSTAEEQANTTQTELDGLQKNLSRARKRLDPSGAIIVEDIDPEFENRLADCESRIHRVNDRIQELKTSLGDVKERQGDAEEELEGLPDFSRFAADPVDWLSGLSGDFATKKGTRDEEASRLERLETAAQGKRDARSETHELFKDVKDFPSEVRAYGAKTKETEEALLRLEQSGEEAKVRAADLQAKIPGFAFVAALGLTGVAFLVVTALYLGNMGIYVPASFAFVVLSYATLGVIFCKRGVRRAHKELDRVKQSTAEVRLADLNARELIEGLMQEKPCETIWEIEAAYDRYREDTLELEMLGSRIEEQQARSRETAEELTKTYDGLRETFRQLGEELGGEGDVPVATTRAIGRYQAYRDAKRRNSESRDVAERIEKELEPLIDERDATKKTELKLALEVRQLLRSYKYDDEKKIDSALKALQGYRLRAAQVRQNRRDVDVLKGRVAQKTEQLEAERKAFAHHIAVLNDLFEEAKVNSLEEYRDRAEAAQNYNTQWQERIALEEQLSAVLGGQDPLKLKESCEKEDIEASLSEQPLDELRDELESLTLALEDKRNEEHALHVAIAQQGTGRRSLNEIEEERAVTDRRMRSLELELQAASYAASIIEEVADARHAELAPKLERLASSYLSEITSGTYSELLVGRDLQIRVRIPQTKVIDDHPEQRLSKGTVDQIYLSLRLAMVQAVSACGEHIPMLLDDPFANYDDLRLARAITLLAHIGAEHQMLLFTCRDDVVRAAKEIDIPIIHL